jgi:electron transfer flavoprotein beta subunit
MRIVVCVHAQADVRDRFTLPPEARSFDGLALVRVTDPSDLAALALARGLTLDKVTITAVSVAPPTAERALREALAYGADEAVRVWSDAFDEASLGGSAVVDALAPTIGDLAPDLVVCGCRGLEAGYGYVGPALAQRLDCAQVAEVTGLRSDGAEGITVERRLSRGRREVVLPTLPVLLTVDASAVELGSPLLKAAIAAEQAQIRVVDAGAPSKPAGDVATGRAAGVLPPRPRTKKTAATAVSAKDRMRAMMSGGGGGRPKSKGVIEGPAQAVATEVIDFLAQNGLLDAN